MISLGGINWNVRFRLGQSGGLWCENDEFIDRLGQLLTSRQELCCLSIHVHRHDAAPHRH